ncbi:MULTISPECIES: Hsp20/alpha crystallin family protein [Actinoalloteichus]|uniref:Molecular chaperone (Small heat shock protein) n=1 Tax=Actinoalloteichus fjordicus TaxID=1612552 RepID=A0AAC9PPM5_9PSEU|nr:MULTISPECIES: Hsp20/alpha crystallin family protein [Actinoalloteichus]APU12214.1 molecular chaperone (small heat shock protein) [Actinoalloteichus fjordicus]APU18166.1 molecular chaperone (small heat shock protein) [Actinoalloteichus sp. GBA129-24]
MAIITRRSGWETFGGRGRELDATFDALVGRAFGAAQTRRADYFTPAADVSRDGTDVLITLELPGVDIDSDVAVEVSAGRLLISGSRRAARETDKGDRIAKEIRVGAFRREFTIPEHVTPDQVEASYDRGLLQVRVSRIVRPEPTTTRVTVRQGATVEAPADGEQSSGQDGAAVVPSGD